MKVAAVAVLLVTSVSIRISATTAITSSTVGRTPRPTTWLPIHSSRPLEATALARLRPPPKSSSTPHGRPF